MSATEEEPHKDPKKLPQIPYNCFPPFKSPGFSPIVQDPRLRKPLDMQSTEGKATSLGGANFSS